LGLGLGLGLEPRPKPNLLGALCGELSPSPKPNPDPDLNPNPDPNLAHGALGLGLERASSARCVVNSAVRGGQARPSTTTAPCSLYLQG